MTQGSGHTVPCCRDLSHAASAALDNMLMSDAYNMYVGCIPVRKGPRFNRVKSVAQDARRAGPMHRFEDPRVDVAVYFIAPHRLKQMDSQFMTELAKCVPVLPVLAKVWSSPTGTRPQTLTLTLALPDVTLTLILTEAQGPSSAQTPPVILIQA